MGNLSHPSINRWGLNLFWYNFWYSDRNKSSNVHQDYFFNRLITLYVNYGITVDRDLFYSKYWYNKESNFFKLHSFTLGENLPIYFRRIEYKNKITNELALVKLRIKKKNAHLTKLWILRFQNWIIINLYFIQPLKKRSSFTEKKKYEKSLLTHKSFFASLRLEKISFIRLIFFYKFINKNQTYKNYYFF